MRYWLVMPAAGTSQRFGGALRKQYAILAGRSVLARSLQVFLADERCLGGAVALAPEDLREPQDRIPTGTRLLRVAGGVRRCDSVLRGLESLAPRAGADDWVLVHDAARPCLARSDLDQLLAAGQRHPIGALLATRLDDTIKQAAPGAPLPQCARTIDREVLWRALTPQMFRYAPLCAALRAAIDSDRGPTDEAQAFEWLGEQPLLVPAKYSNLKITTAEDLLIAAALLAARDPLAARESA
jgi:2-C-methyl-D-erythritol 4-phosphate cytidylyltransferase